MKIDIKRILIVLLIPFLLHAKDIEGIIKYDDYTSYLTKENGFPFQLEVKYKLTTLMGDPLLKAIAKYKITGNSFYYKNVSYPSSKYSSELKKAKIINLYVLFALSLEDDENSLYYIESSMGAMGRENEWSFNPPTGYDWNHFIFRKSSDGYKEYLKEEQAKEIYKKIKALNYFILGIPSLKISKIDFSFVDFNLKEKEGKNLLSELGIKKDLFNKDDKKDINKKKEYNIYGELIIEDSLSKSKAEEINTHNDNLTSSISETEEVHSNNENFNNSYTNIDNEIRNKKIYKYKHKYEESRFVYIYDQETDTLFKKIELPSYIDYVKYIDNENNIIVYAEKNSNYFNFYDPINEQAIKKISYIKKIKKIRLNNEGIIYLIEQDSNPSDWYSINDVYVLDGNLNKISTTFKGKINFSFEGYGFDKNSDYIYKIEVVETKKNCEYINTRYLKTWFDFRTGEKIKEDYFWKKTMNLCLEYSN